MNPPRAVPDGPLIVGSMRPTPPGMRSRSGSSWRSPASVASAAVLVRSGDGPRGFSSSGIDMGAAGFEPATSRV